MERETSRPRVADLGFRVDARAIHPDWLAVRAHRRVVLEGWDVDLRIVEGGHAIQWRSGPARITEIVAAKPTLAEIPEDGRLLGTDFRRERSVTLRPHPGLEYRSSFEVERCDPSIFDHLNDEAALDASPDALRHAYRSGPGNRLAPPAISLVRFEARPSGISIHTFHSIPEERAILRTHSLIESRLPTAAR